MPPPFASYLRVYEPLIAFDHEQQQHWRRYAATGATPTTLDGPGRQRNQIIGAVGVAWSRLPQLPEDGYLLEDNGSLFVCPWSLRVRVAEAALAVREGVPPTVADAFVPPTLADTAEHVIADWHSAARVLEHGRPRQHEHVAAWTVPLRWFVLVDLDERELTIGEDIRRLRYRTSMARARRRAHRALAVLRRGVGDSPITRATEEATRWLEEFHPRSIVELDYGGLAQLLDDEALASDNSPALVADGLAALTQGDGTAASEAYAELVERWRTVQQYERIN